jgi:hypothetical protein
MLDFRPAWDRRARHVLALLAEERDLLRAGRIADLARLAERRDRLVAGLLEAPPERSAETEALIASLQREAGRNGRLLGAFLEGMKTAGRALARRGAEAPIGLYGAAGARLPEPGPAPRSDRRA